MPVYSDKAILEAIDNGVLSITPLKPNNVQPASVDLTLGEDIEILTPGDIDLFSTDREVLKTRTKTHNIRDGYKLTPNSYVVGYSAEYLHFSTFINGRIDNRNSLARLGLDVSAGCYINPGFEGHMSLVIRNFGQSAIILHPGVRICQLVIFHLTGQSIRNYDNRHDLDSIISQAMQHVPGINLQKEMPKDTSLADFLDERITSIAKRGLM